MIPLAVLWQYVKVFFGEHRLEFRDVGGQRSGSSLCLFAMPGSLRETLGGRSHRSEVGLSELQKEVCKEEPVSRLPIGGIQLWRGFFRFFQL